MVLDEFCAGKLLSNTAVWETSIYELESYGFHVPKFVKRMIAKGELNLFDTDLFRSNHKNWTYNKKRYAFEHQNWIVRFKINFLLFFLFMGILRRMNSGSQNGKTILELKHTTLSLSPELKS